jgi:predicted nucleic acid-binding protein
MILDSTILVKLVVNEITSQEASKTVTLLLRRGHPLCTVDLALTECVNAIWKHANLHKDLKLDDAKAAVHDLEEIYDHLDIFAARQLVEEALNICLAQNITVYDALYIAAANKADATLYTADLKLHEKASKIARSKLLKP